MADGQRGAPSPDAQSGAQAGGAQALARDWITIWQSELAALATDRELQDSWVRFVTLWGQAANTAATLLPGAATGERAGGRAGAAAAAGPTAPVAASDPRDATIERLAVRTAELERRLAGLDAAAERDRIAGA